MQIKENEIKLIIHMDDMGMSYAANQAGIELFERGLATSASVMVSCAWAYDFIQWSKNHPQYDVGIHLTHTCEWDVARWRPLSCANEVPHLIDSNGFLAKSVHKKMNNEICIELVKEAQKQIHQALNWGFNPTHFDNHMWSFMSSTDSLCKYLELTKKYGRIAHIPQWALWDEKRKALVNQSRFRVMQGVSTNKQLIDLNERKNDFLSFLKTLKSGIYIWTLHPIIDTPEIRVIIPQWESRYMEYLLLSTTDLIEKMLDQGIQLITWRNLK